MKNKFRLMLVLITIAPFIANSATSSAPRLADPTRPPDITESSPSSTATLNLTAIFSYPDHQVAVINQQAVAVGDKIGDFSVTSITRNTVELRGSDNETVRLELVPDIKGKR